MWAKPCDIILLLFISAIFVSCKKEYSCEGCIPKQAKFSLICDSVKVNGSYVKGSGLNADNTVQYLVSVDSPGVYSLSTSAINGISFSTSGSFTSPGIQTIVLNGAGTPAQPGTYFYSTSLDSCNFPITVLDKLIDTFYYEGTINGQFYTSKTGNGYVAVSGVGIIHGAKDTARFQAKIEAQSPRPANATELTISKGWYVDFANATQAQFKAYFNPGNYTYGNPMNFTAPVVNGMGVTWYDETGKRWESDPSTNQTGRSIAIVSVDDYQFTPIYRIKVMVTFNCILYDGLGNQKTLTNGKLFGLFSM
jgi:hypothetical protein